MAETAAVTLQSLEWRLKRLEHFLGAASKEHTWGDFVETDPKPANEAIDVRLKRLESRTQHLIRNNRVADSLLTLYTQYPELDPKERSPKEFDDALAAKLPIVLSSAKAYTDMVSSLNTLQQYPLPESRELITLLNQASRLDKLEAIQQQQLAEIAQLRQRSTALVAQWYQAQVLDSSERWSLWEERLLHSEQTVRRKEIAKAREEDDA